MTVPKFILLFLASLGEIGGPADCVRINAGRPRPSQPASLQHILAFGLKPQVNDGDEVKPAPFGDKGMVWFPLRYKGRLEPLCFSLRKQQIVDWLPLLQPFLKYKFARLAGKPTWICLWPAAETYNRYWTCSKQEHGTENIKMYPEKRSPKRLVCYLPLMVLFQQLCRFRLCDDV